jgi:hypothetical protein
MKSTALARIVVTHTLLSALGACGSSVAGGDTSADGSVLPNAVDAITRRGRGDAVTLDTMGVSRFAKPASDPTPDPDRANFTMEGRARELLTLAGGDFAVVGEVIAPTRVLRLSKLAR